MATSFLTQNATAECLKLDLVRVEIYIECPNILGRYRRKFSTQVLDIS